ncbi:M23 family metallopeptidase [Curvivirga aplysinae]|uniref:M23 family metallopeptidase n=1 Tax=Curvivirga aplysinae TaxID=2529852 RepID=UPI001F4062F8|nr:M23 family metallopeptidase [Curvivirga aplysinae]
MIVKTACFKAVTSIFAGAMLFVSLSTQAADRTKLDGRFIQGGMVIGQTEKGAKVTFQDHELLLSDEGQFVFGFHRDAPESQNLTITYTDGSSETIPIAIEQREYNVQRIDGLPSKQVSPPEEIMVRIRDDNRQIGEARANITDEDWYLEDFIWPSVGPISGIYGSQRILNGQPRQPHYGIDIALPTGSPVVAPASGIIRLVHDDMYFSGGTLFLDHGAGLMSAFLHLSKIHVKEGQFVKQGELIADIGATGRVTGAHLDWRINWFENRIDPALLVPPMPK